MGITGLLPFLEKSSRKTSIKEFSGGAVAIDTYCWLHKGVFSCAEKLMMEQPTDAYVLYCIKYINMLLKFNIKPILVFDGRRLPAKEHTEIKRRESRQMNRRKAMELIKMGKIIEGRNLLKRAIDISHEIALELIKYCQNENIDCIVAPYEADAQLAYLNINNIADVVITEDSDLMLFGCKKVFFKMDLNGNGVLIEQDRLHLAMDMQPEQFNMEKFRYICILSGCDYLSSLPGIGLRKAQKFIMKNIDENIYRALGRIASVLNMKSLVVTQDYKDAFILADITFKHQLVFCPLQRKQVRLNPPAINITEDQLRYAGEELDADLALQLALGNCDPSTLKMLHDFNPDKIERKRKRSVKTEQAALNHVSIWSNKYEVKAKSNELSCGNAMNSTITNKKKQILRKNSLKDMFVSSNHNSPTIQREELSEYQNLSDDIVLDMYNHQDVKTPVASPERKSKEPLCAENNVSPELFKQKNPFVKRVSDLTTSPSILSNGNYLRRGRNLLRIRRTIVDENNIVESKYFSKKDDEKHNSLQFENSIEDADTKSAKYNIIPDTDSILCTSTNDNEANQETLSQCINNLAEYTNSKVHIRDALLPMHQNECTTDCHGNVFEKPCSENSLMRTPPTEHYIIDKNYTPNNVMSSNCDAQPIDNSVTDRKSPNSLRKNLFKWSNTSSTPKKKLENSKKTSSENLVLRVSSATKRARQSKPSPPSQQNLLSMYGFQKRSSLKH